MIAAALVVGVLGQVALIVALMVVLRSHASQARAWGLERRELLNRIQRPEMVPQTVPEQWVAPEAEPDESNLVGTIAEPDADE